jgi:hypothetical protein
MKLGNTSQSIVPVPNFFLTRTLKEMDTFNISLYKKNYFRETDLFKKTADINISNNPRNRNRKYEQYNRTKFIPVHRMQVVCDNTNLMTTVKDDSASDSEIEKPPKKIQAKPAEIQTKQGQINTYYNELNQRSQNFREQIKQNFDNLLDSLNKRFVLGPHAGETTENYYKTNSEQYSLITTFNRNNENENLKFKRDIINKIDSLNCVSVEKKNKIINDIASKDSQNTYLLPYITAKENFNKTLDSLVSKGSDVGTRLNFYRTTRPGEEAKLITNREDFWKPRERRPDILIDENKFMSTKARKMFSEDYDHQEFLKKYIK